MPENTGDSSQRKKVTKKKDMDNMDQYQPQEVVKSNYSNNHTSSQQNPSKVKANVKS